MAQVVSFPQKVAASGQNWLGAAEAEIWRSHVRLFERSGAEWRAARRIAHAEFAGQVTATLAFLAEVEFDWSQAVALGAAEQKQQMLTIPARVPEGFDIAASFDGGSVKVAFGGLEQDFSSVPAAFQWIGRALSGNWQLRTVLAGDLPHEWWLEPVAADADPRDVLASGEVRLRSLWKARSEVVQRN